VRNDVPCSGGIIRRAREEKGLTQARLAEITGISLRTVIAIEHNQRHPTFEVLWKLMRALDISAGHIFNTDEMLYTPEQEPIIREILSCTKDERDIVLATMRCLIRKLREKRL
jgi:transcriptional regulator with XRE-family HTH domain